MDSFPYYKQLDNLECGRMRDAYMDKYYANAIPKFILIDPDGVIINSCISEPSLAVEKLIEQELKLM